MKQHRYLSAILVLILVLSIVQPAFAAREDWDDWVTVKAPTCTETGLRTRRSTLGNTQREVIPATGHQYGDLTVVSEATCLQKARAERTCRVCGHTEWTYVGELGDHKWGEWENVDMPDGVPIMKRQRTCAVCGKTEEEEIDLPVMPGLSEPDKPKISLKVELLKPGPFKRLDKPPIRWTLTNECDETLYYVGCSIGVGIPGWPTELAPHQTYSEKHDAFQITQDNVNQAKLNHGVIPNNYEVYYKNAEGVTAKAECRVDFPIAVDITYALVVTGYIPNGPHDEPYVEGEKVKIKVDTYNTAEGKLKDIVVDLNVNKHTGTINKCPALDPGKAFKSEFDYTISDFDIGKEQAEIVLTATGKAVEDDLDVKSEPFTITLKTGKKPAPKPSISLTASLINPKVYHKFESVSFELKLTNQCDETLHFSGTNAAPAEGWPAVLNPHQSATLHMGWQISSDNIENAKLHGGTYSSKVEVVYRNDAGEKAVASTDCVVPLEEHAHKLTLSASIPGGPVEPYFENDIITFHVTARNEGSSLLYGVCIGDPEGKTHGNITLEPGKSFPIDYEYTVTDIDASTGTISVTFEASGWPEPGKLEISADPVTIDLEAVLKDGEHDPLLTLGVSGGSAGEVTKGTNILLTMTASNMGKDPVAVTALNADPAPENAEDKKDGWLSIKGLDIMPENAPTFPYTIVVSDDDIAQGKVHREFSLGYVWTDESGENHHFQTNTIPVDIALSDAGSNAELTLTCVSNPAGGAGVGDEATGWLQIINTGSTPVEITGLYIQVYPGRYNPDAKDSVSDYSSLIGTVLLPSESSPKLKYSTVIQPEDMGAGAVKRSLYASGYYGADPENDPEGVVMSNEAILNVGLVPEETFDPVTVHKSRLNEPQDGIGFQIGEKIKYQIKVTNNSDYRIHGLVLLDPIFKEMEVPVVDSFPGLDPSESWTVKFEYTVTPDDMNSTGILYNQAMLDYTYSLDEEDYVTPSNIVEAPLNDTRPNGGVGLFKTCTNEPDNKKYYIPGEKIKYKLEFRNNTGRYLFNVKITDPLAFETFPGGVIAEYAQVEPGFTATYTYEYTVTGPDADHDQVVNIAHISALDKQQPYGADSNTVIRPAGYPDNYEGLSIKKNVIGEPDNKKYYVLGEWINYEITITNNSDTTISKITVSDSLKKEDGGVLGIVTDLHPAESRTFKFSYQVQEKDVGSVVYNTGMADYLTSLGIGHVEDTVRSSTGEDIPPVLRGDGGDSCVRELIASGPERKEYTITYCALHQETAEQAAALLEASENDEDHLAACQKAVQLWRETLEQMYAAMSDTLPSSAGGPILGSRNAFMAFLDDYESALRAAGKDEISIATTMAGVISARCVDLCYTLHHAPDPARPDSALNGSVTALMRGFRDEKCSFRLMRDPDGKAQLIETLCPSHSAIEETLIRRLALEKEDPASAFESAEFSYRCALSAGQVSLRGVMRGQSKQLAMINCQASAASLLDRDAELYLALYADHPETAAEILSTEARELAILLCTD